MTTASRKSSVRTRESPEIAMVCSESPLPLLREFEQVIMIAVGDRRDGDFATASSAISGLANLQRNVAQPAVHLLVLADSLGPECSLISARSSA